MCIVRVCISTAGVGEGIVTRKCNENEINQTEKNLHATGHTLKTKI